MSVFLTAAVGALFGVMTGLIVQWWKSARDELRILCDEICDAIAASSDAASECWLSAGGDAGISLKEIRVQGFQKRLSGYNALVIGRLHDAAVDDIESALARYFDACTGGDFGNPERIASTTNAKQVQDKAADAILAVRRGFFESVNFREKAWRLAQKMWPLREGR